jgi:hypothetical protein
MSAKSSVRGVAIVVASVACMTAIAPYGSADAKKEGAPEVEAAVPAPSASASPAPSASVDQQTVPIADRGAGARAVGWSLLGGGLIVGIIGGVTGVVASTRLSKRRSDLDEHCVGPVDDTCPRPKPGADAQSDVDAIASWKAVRTVGFVGGGVGLMVAGVGLLRLLTAPPPPKTAAFWQPRLEIGANGAFLSIEGAL